MEKMAELHKLAVVGPTGEYIKYSGFDSLKDACLTVRKILKYEEPRTWIR